MISKECCRRRQPPEEINEISNELGECHLGQRREEVEEQHERECRPDRLDEMPVKRPKRIGRTRNCPALERVDPRFEPAEHHAFSIFVTRRCRGRSLLTGHMSCRRRRKLVVHTVNLVCRSLLTAESG